MVSIYMSIQQLDTLQISHILKIRLKKRALNRDITLRKLLEEIITNYLKKNEK